MGLCSTSLGLLQYFQGSTPAMAISLILRYTSNVNVTHLNAYPLTPSDHYHVSFLASGIQHAAPAMFTWQRNATLRLLVSLNSSRL